MKKKTPIEKKRKIPAKKTPPPPKDNQGWDEYWDHNNAGQENRRLYNLIAEFYRKFIIRPNLNRFVKKYFPAGTSILHAGCGSGQVDRDIRHHVRITGLDISKNALAIFKKENGQFCDQIHGSIFKIPAPAHSFQGIYNLGVMEHFSEKEIFAILKEFKRVLTKDGKILIFWPPEFGASVLFFKILKVVLRPIYGKGIKFHPDEISRIKSKKNAYGIFEAAGFAIVEYSFGIRDAFTYSVIVAQNQPHESKGNGYANT